MNTNQEIAYFNQLNNTLKNYKSAIPYLIIDLDRLDENIKILKSQIKPVTQYRIVVKSLPALSLIKYVMEKSQTNNLMVFHQPFLTQLATYSDTKADLLLGKPMPIQTARFFYNHLSDTTSEFNPYTQIQWLIDTQNRLEQYLGLAKKLDQKLRVNLEIDVGLHRGGFMDLESFKSALQFIRDNDTHLTLSGLMGYDPHVVKLPYIVRTKEKALSMANTFYQKCIDLLQKDFPALYHSELCFNGAGSPTINLHSTDSSPLNDVSAGSCLVMPTTFDIDTLSDYKPACFIATPILKKFKDTMIPGIEIFKNLLGAVDRANKQSFFIYGGFWKADYCYPKGLKENKIYGSSTNQTMLNAPLSAEINVDDFIFLRPHQSEFVFLQFGNILAVRGQSIVEEWPVLKQ